VGSIVTGAMVRYNIVADGFKLATEVSFESMMEIVNGEKSNYDHIHVTEA